MDCSTHSLPVPSYIPELAQIHFHWNGDATQQSHLLSPSSPSAFNLSQHQGLFQWVDCSHQVAKVTNLDSTLKSRDVTLPTKAHTVKAMVFPVVMLSHKEGWVPKNWCFPTAVLETLENPLDCKETKPINPKEINPEHSLDELMLKLKLQHFGHLVQTADSLEKTQMLGKTEGRRRRGWQRMMLDGIIKSMDMSLSKLGDSEGQGRLECYS